MNDITLSGAYTPRTNETDSQIKQDVLDQISAKLVGSGIIANDASLVTITHNDDGSVHWSYTLEAPDASVTQNDANSATNKLEDMSSSDDSFTDVYNIMAEFFVLSSEMRKSSDAADKSRLDSQISKLKESAQDLRDGAGWGLAGGLLMGAAQVIAGSADIAGAGAMKGSLNEASELSDQAMQETRIARTAEFGQAPKAPQAELELDEVGGGDESSVEDDDDDVSAPKRKLANADLNESMQSGDEQDADMDVNQKSQKDMELETEQKIQQQKQKANQAENEDDAKRARRADYHKEKAEILKQQADLKTKNMGRQESLMRGVGAMTQGIGGMLNAIGQYGDTMKQSDSKDAEAQATVDAAYRDMMSKVRDSSIQGMQSALQGMQQAIQIEASMTSKVFA